MKNPKNNPKEVENLDENDLEISNDDIGENSELTPIGEAVIKEQKANSSKENNNEQDGKRRIEKPQFPVENQKKPDPSDTPQDDIETIAP